MDCEPSSEDCSPSTIPAQCQHPLNICFLFVSDMNLDLLFSLAGLVHCYPSWVVACWLALVLGRLHSPAMAGNTPPESPSLSLPAAKNMSD